MKWMPNFLIILFTALLLPATASACSCLSVGPACEEVSKKGRDAIFVGRVLNIESVTLKTGRRFEMFESSKRVTIAVEEAFRGITETSVSVFTPSSEAACGYSFRKNVRYLIFAFRDAGRLMVVMCSATAPAKYVQEDITYLRSMPKLPPTARVYGTFKRYTYDPRFVPKFQPSIMDHYRPPEEEYRAMEPMTGTTVQVHTETGDHAAVVDKDGKWNIEGVPPGPYEIRVKLPPNLTLDLAWGLHGTLAPKGCAEVNLRTESNGHLRGTIISKVPLSDYYLAQVAVFRVGEREFDILRPFGELFPEKTTGDFDLGPLPPGRYYLAAILTEQFFLNDAVIFYPGVQDIQKAQIITLGDGETRSGFEIPVKSPRFEERQGFEHKIKAPKEP